MDIFGCVGIVLWQVVAAETEVEEDEEPDGGVWVVVPCIVALLSVNEYAWGRGEGKRKLATSSRCFSMSFEEIWL